MEARIKKATPELRQILLQVLFQFSLYATQQISFHRNTEKLLRLPASNNRANLLLTERSVPRGSQYLVRTNRREIGKVLHDFTYF